MSTEIYIHVIVLYNVTSLLNLKKLNEDNNIFF
jgi:hypothetical protein